MLRCIPLLILLTCRPVRAEETAAAPPVLVIDSGGHTSIVWQVLFTPDGRELISVSSDKTIRIWDVASGEPSRVLRTPIGPGEEGKLYAAVLAPDGRTLAVGGVGLKDAYGSIYLISMTTGRIERVLKGHTSSIHSLSFATLPGGHLLLASGSYDNTARIWDVATGECRRVLEGHTDAVLGVAFAPDGSKLATASYDKTARIWSVADGGCLQTLRGYAKRVACVAWSPDGTLLATGGEDRSIRLWSPDGVLARTIGNLGGWISSVTFTADSSELLYTWGSPYGDGSGCGAAVVRVASGEHRARFTRHDNTVQSGAISPDGAVAATSGGNSREIYLWKLSNASTLHRLAGKGQANWSAAWSPDGKRIAWGNTLRNTPSFNDLGPLERSFSLTDLEFGTAPDATYRRARESRGSLSLRHTGRTELEVKQQDSVVAKIALPNSTDPIQCWSFVTADRIAVGSYFRMYLHDALSGARVREFRGHTDVVRAVAPSPDGRFLLSASSDQTLRIWDPGRNEPLLSLFFAGDDWIAWTPEGYYAASPGGENLMGWQLGNGPEQVGTFVPASQFHKSLYRPDIIKLALQTGSVASALERLNKPGPTVQAITEVLPPLVVITSPDRSGVRLDGSELTVRAKAVAQPGHPVTALRLLLDGRPYEGELGRKDLRDDPAGARQKAESWLVRLDPGRHRLAVVAESDVSNGRSEDVEVIYDVPRADPPRLYALLVGVADYEEESLRLRYAADDAQLLEQVLRDKATRAFAGGAEVRRLVDRQATKEGFYDGLQWLRDSIKPQDVGIVFFSGHGHRDDDGIFYMLPAEVKRRSIAATGLDGALFKRKLAGIKGKLVVMLDACHSGAAEKDAGGERPLRPITDDFVRDMAREDSGVVMMCSSTGREVSIEDPGLGHGFFTQALVDGLSGQADLNKDGLVYLTELDDYLFERVKALSHDRQHAVTAKPASVVPFILSRP
jgi:WD40 repeat protein